jgi:hypothetical protein
VCKIRNWVRNQQMDNEMKEERFEQRMRREITNLYSNEGLTSNLNDSSAKIFLNWAEQHVRKIVDSTAGMDDELADEVMYPRLKVIRTIARYLNQAVEGRVAPTILADKIVSQAKKRHGDEIIEPEIDKLSSLLSMPEIDPELFIQTLQYLLEGDMDGEED